MPTQGERQQFLWRPNDNSTTTKLRYDLETKHWMDGVRSYNITNKYISFGEAMGVVGLLLSLLLGIVYLILSGIVSLFKSEPKEFSLVDIIDDLVIPDDTVYYDDYTEEELDEIFSKSSTEINP